MDMYRLHKIVSLKLGPIHRGTVGCQIVKKTSRCSEPSIQIKNMNPMTQPASSKYFDRMWDTTTWCPIEEKRACEQSRLARRNTFTRDCSGQNEGLLLFQLPRRFQLSRIPASRAFKSKPGLRSKREILSQVLRAADDLKLEPKLSVQRIARRFCFPDPPP